jgi:MoaA/NifB/PqqE/SkfB family radical SAM enzyme
MGLLARVCSLLRTKRLSDAPPVEKDVLPHPAYKDILLELQNLGEDIDLTAPFLLELERQDLFLDKYDALAYLLDRHPFPHNVNYILSCEERARGIAKLKSLPPNVQMDLTSFCNVECRFCKYKRGYHSPHMVTLEQIKAIEWFKFIKWLNFSAGTGESITNPQFIEIFDHIRNMYPRLQMEFLTNGIALKERVVDAIVGRLDRMHISMNASNEEDYHKAIKGGNWSIFSKNLRYLQAALRNADRPKISASFVMMRWNIEKAVQYLEFAADIGASLVLFHHYYTPYIHDIHGSDPTVIEDKFPKHESLYYHRELSDREFAKVKERAQELGIQVQLPVPFSEGQYNIAYASRTKDDALTVCPAPWQNMFILWGFKSKREEVTICCGLASDIGAFLERDEIASREGLMKVWNSPILQAYRRTVNGKRVNPICALCRKIDRFDPDALYPDQSLFYKYNELDIPPHLRSPARDNTGSG